MVNTVFRALCAKLDAAGVPDARFDAVQLYRFATGRDPRLEDAPAPEERERLQTLAARRAAREPLQYILGTWDFMGLTLKVGAGVLCPRADTEVVCEAAIEALRGRSAPVVYDLCAGTGCLGLGVAKFVPGARVTCVENDEAAFSFLLANTQGTSVRAVRGDVFSFYKTLKRGTVDVIVSNPPYLSASEMAELMPETAHEPAAALAGGADGLDFYRVLTQNYRDVLRPDGVTVLEIGAAQADAVTALARQNGWRVGSVRRDYGGNDRAVILKR